MTTISVQPKLLLRNGSVVLPDRLLNPAAVLMEGGRIASIVLGEAASLSADVSLDLDGLTLYPGFIDVHLHGAVGVDTMDASAAQLSQVSQFLVTQGVTGWLPTLVPAAHESYAGAVKEVERLIAEQQSAPQQSGPRVLGVHYEGPFVNIAQCGALHAEHFQTYSDAAQLNGLPVLTASGARMMMTLAPEIEGGIDLVRDLSSKGWIVSLGHTRALPEVLDRAHQAGAHHMTHFMNAMAPLHQRSPGPIAWGLMRDDVSCDVVADGIHLDPLMLRLLLKVKRPQRLSLISDSIAAAGMGDGEYKIWGETIAVSNGRTSNAAGSIAGSVITMLDAVRLMLTLGVSEVDAARMASSNPARLLQLYGECGSIEEGKRADLVALDEHGNVRLTIIGGLVAFQASPR
jgi:N-acetylglucosamine-6-phosphate deacetylase